MVRFPVGSQDFLFVKPIRPNLGLTETFVQFLPGETLPGITQSGRGDGRWMGEADSSPAPNAQVRNKWIYNSTSSRHVQGQLLFTFRIVNVFSNKTITVVSEISVHSYQISRRHMQEDSDLRNHRRGNCDVTSCCLELWSSVHVL